MCTRQALFVFAIFAAIASVLAADKPSAKTALKFKQNLISKKTSVLSTKVDLDEDTATADDVFIPFVARQTQPSPTSPPPPSPSRTPAFPFNRFRCSFPEYSGRRSRIPRRFRRNRRIRQGTILRYNSNIRLNTTGDRIVTIRLRKVGRNRRIVRFGIRLYSGGRDKWTLTRPSQTGRKTRMARNSPHRFTVFRTFDMYNSIRRKRNDKCCREFFNAFIFMRMCTDSPPFRCEANVFNHRFKLPCTNTLLPNRR